MQMEALLTSVREELLFLFLEEEERLHRSVCGAAGLLAARV
jgi:hypothetical protein